MALPVQHFKLNQLRNMIKILASVLAATISAIGFAKGPSSIFTKNSDIWTDNEPWMFVVDGDW